MGTKFYSCLHRYVSLVALVVALFLPSLAVTANAECGELTNVSVVNAAPTSATLQWTVAAAARHDYDIRVSTQSLSTSALPTVTVETAGVVVCLNAQTLADDSYSITGLNAGAHYYVYVRQNCEWDYQGTSAWKSCEFYTPCTATNVLPVSAGFDGTTSLPSCWYASGVSPVVQSSIHYGSAGNAVGLSATASEACYLYSPVFSSDAHAYQLNAQVYGRTGSLYKIGVAPANELQSIELIVNGTIGINNQWIPVDAVMPEYLQQAVEQGAEYVWVIYCPSADGASTVYFDNIVIDEVPTCISPAELTASNVEDASVTLAWTERGTATAWVVEYVHGTDTLTTNASANPFVLSGLLSNTNYTIRVKAVCSATDESAWSTPVAVKTICGSYPLPFIEDFTGLTGGIPECWDNSLHTCVASYNWNFNSAGYAGPCMMFNAYNAAANSTGSLLTPVIANGDVTSMVLTFYLKNGDEAALDVYASTDGGATFPQHIVTSELGTSEWAEYEAYLSAPANSSVVLKFVATSDYGSENMYLDNIAVVAAPSCLKPSGLHVSAINQTDFTLAWTPSGNETAWELQYRLDSAEVQTVLVNNTPEYTVSGLEMNRRYSLSRLSLRAVCSATDSSAVVAFSNTVVKTACGLLNLPYTETFDAYVAGTSTAAGRPADPTYPDCWTILNEAGAADFPKAYISSISGYNISGKSFFVQMSATDPLYAVLPTLNLTDSTRLTISFSYRNEGTGNYNGHVQLGYMTNAADTASFVLVREYTQVTSMTEVEENVTLPANGQFAFRFVGGATDNYYASVDNVNIVVASTCARPAALTASPLSGSEVAVVITDNEETHNAWEVVVVAQGEDPTAATPVQVSTKIATVPATLVSGTSYEVYVRTVCSADDQSAFRGPATFTYVDYSSVTNLPIQGVGEYPWEIVQDGSITKLQSTNQGVNSSESEVEATVIVPEGAEATVSFDYYASGEGSTYMYDYLVIYVDEANPTMSNYVTDFANNGKAGTPAGVSGTYSIYFAQAGSHTIRWRFHKDSSTNDGDDMAQIWNIRLVNTTAWAPKNLELRSVDAHSATIAWEQCADVVKNEVVLSDSIHFESTTNSISLTDLASSTAYTIKVRSILDNDTTDWSGSFSFRTDCAERTIPFAESFEGDGDELCWKVIGNAVDKSTTTVAFDGTKALKVVNDSVAGMLISPRLDAETLANYEVNLAVNLAAVRYHGALKSLTIGVMTDPNDVSTYIDLGDIVIPSSGSYKEYRQSLEDLATADYAEWAGAQYVVVSMSDSATYYFDAITVAPAATCPKPTALDVLPNGETSVVAWVSDAAAHYAEIALGDSVVFAGEVQNPFTPQGLDANTTYKVRVRATCGDGNSEWTPWVSFKTPCSYTAVPYEEGFEGYTAATFPDCWERTILSGPGTAGFVVNTSTGTTYNHAGTRSLKLSDMQATTYSLAVLPMFNSPSENGLTLSFWMYRTTGTSKPEEGVRVWVNNVPSLDGATALMHVTRCGGVAADSLKVAPITSAGWYQYEKTLPITGATYIMFEGISEYGLSSYIDDIRVIETPTCVKPTGLQVVEESITTTSAQLTWNAGLDETQWQLVYRLSTKGVNDTVVVSGTPSYTLTDLLVGKTYTLSNISLQSICSATDSSEVVTFSDLSFNTVCDVVSLPFAEDFNGITAGIPACWDNTEGTTTTEAQRWNYYVTGNTGHAVRFNSYSNSNGKTNELHTPAINVGNASQVDVSFMYKNPTGGNYEVYLIHVGGDTVQLATGLTGVTAWTEFAASVAVTPNEQIMLSFYGVSNYGNGDAYLYLDDVEVTPAGACGRPEGVRATAVTDQAATIIISDSEGAAWEYTVNDQEATPVAVSDSVFTITGLTSQTDYTVFVRRVCGADASAWRSVSFRTACAPVSYINEDFESWTTGSTGDRIPECWTLMASSSTTYPYIYSYSSYASSGTNSLYMYSYYTSPGSALIALPMVEGNLNQYRLKLHAKASTPSNGASPIFVLGSNTANYDEMVADTLNYDVINNGNPIVPTSEHQEYIVSLANYQGDGHYVVLYLYQLASTLYIDDVILEPIPSCDYPQSITILNATASAVDVLIADTVASHTAWEVVAVAQGANPATGTPVVVNTKAASIAGTFVSGTAYDLYVRTICSESDQSSYAGPVSFTFVDYSAATDLPVQGAGDYPWTVVNDGGVTKLQSTNQGAHSTSSDLMATFVVPEGAMGELSFDYYGSGEGSYTLYDYLCVYVDQASPSSYNYQTDFASNGRAGSPSGVTGTYSISLAPGTHTVLWRFTKDGSSNGGDDMGQIWNLQMNYNHFFVPTNLGVDSLTALSANLVWSAGSEAILNEVLLVSAENDTLVATTADNNLHVALEESTAYTFMVRSFNEANDTTAWSSAYNFTTPARCIVPAGINVISVDETQVNIQIVDNDTTHNAWQVAFGPQTFDPDAEDAFIVDVENSLVAINPAQPLVSGHSYDIYVRAVCTGEIYSDWATVKTVKYVDVSGVSDININMSEGEYPWIAVTAADGTARLQSSNMGHNSTTSDMTATVVVDEGERGTLSFNYYGSGEGASTLWDYLCVYVDKATPSTSNYQTDFAQNGRAGTPEGMSGLYSVELAPGTHTIRWRFYKDGSSDGGDDYGQVWNIRFRSVQVVRADTVHDGTCAGSDYEGYGFSLTADQLHAGNNYFEWTRAAESDLEADTVYTLNLFVSQPSVQQFRDTVCAHEHYTGYGFDIADVDPLRTSYERHLTNIYGCDSTVYLLLFVPQSEFVINEHLCEGASYVFGDTTVTTSGTYVRSYQNIYGCDSTITLNIFFHATSSAISATICSGETFVFGDQTLSTAGTYTRVVPNAAGCDSTITLTLNVIQPVITQLNGVFCEGTTFAGGSISPEFMGLDQPGTYTDTLQSLVTGCDSILVLNLVMESTQHTTVEGTYSQNKPFVFNGQSYQETGTFTVYLTSVNGCDSIITLIVKEEGTALDNLAAGQLQVAPNPVLAGMDITILTDIELAGDYKLRVYDAVGKLAYETTTPVQTIPGLPTAGVYTVRITTGNRAYQAKLIVR